MKEGYRKVYLRSSRWESFRRDWLKRHGGWCRACGSKGRLDLHHLSYERLGSEDDDDVTALCRSDHQLAHEFFESGRYSDRASAT